MNFNSLYNWPRCPEAEALIEKKLDEALSKNSNLRTLSEELLTHTSSRLFDWVDHVILPLEQADTLKKLGFERIKSEHNRHLYHHPAAQFPLIILANETLGVGVLVESIEDYLLMRGLGGEIKGAPFASYRESLISKEHEVNFWIVERREYAALSPSENSLDSIEKHLRAEQLWAARPRSLDDEKEAFRISQEIALKMVELVGAPHAAVVAMEGERKYWQARNRAGQVQKARQDFLGMGWANHDHHTFRSSREHFVDLVKLLEILGFHVRERFYAGEEAGWGAQVMEHSDVRLVMFLDVDLLPEELSLDFAHVPLPPTPKLGTIGLWCALHGDSILKSGMHHLESQFMFEDLALDLKDAGVDMMAPFSDFTYLKQAFTKGEVWPVDKIRVERLLEKRLITEEQKKRFLERGAIGSHMENLQRREGYKGFNQKNVSFIIKETDPRNLDH